ncbi:hypothetical protein BVZ80_01250B, partial [Haemophilus influenzae]
QFLEKSKLPQQNH